MRSVEKTRGGKRMNRTRRGGKRSVRTRRGGKRSVRTRRGGKKQRIIKGGASTSDPALNASKLLNTTSQPTSIPTSDIDITNHPLEREQQCLVKPIIISIKNKN